MTLSIMTQEPEAARSLVLPARVPGEGMKAQFSSRVHTGKVAQLMIDRA